jgi:hypothetical protein
LQAFKKAREVLKTASDSTSAASSSFLNKTRDARHRAAGETRKEWRTIGYHVVNMLKPIDTNSQPAILEGLQNPFLVKLRMVHYLITTGENDDRPSGLLVPDFWRSQGGSLRELWSYEDGCSQYVLEFG